MSKTPNRAARAARPRSAEPKETGRFARGPGLAGTSREDGRLLSAAAASPDPRRTPPPPSEGGSGRPSVVQHSLDRFSIRPLGTNIDPAGLEIGTTSDRWERQAERLASEISTIRPAGEPGRHRANPPQISRLAGRSGRPLDATTRDYMERRFDHDLGAVRIHADPQAARSARRLGARAFTVGTHVVFGTGEFTPSTAAGKRLLAHELTHVVQQAGEGGKQGVLEGPRLSTPRIQRLPESEFRRLELRRRARGLDDEALARRIAELRAALGEESDTGSRSGGESPLGRPRLVSPRLGGVRGAARSSEEQELDRAPGLLEGPMRADPAAASLDPVRDRRRLELEVFQAEQRARERRAERERQIRELVALLDDPQRGWHRRLPRARSGELTTTPGSMRGGRTEPRLVRPSSHANGLVPMNGVVETRARELYLERVRERLDRLTVPTDTEQLRLWGTRRRRDRDEYPGYVWGQRTDRPAGVAEDYAAYLGRFRRARTRQQAAALGVPLATRRDLSWWQVFVFMTSEGDPASVNTWDNQLVTLGAGFSARSGNGAQLLARMPEDFLARLYRHGIRVDTASNQLVVLDHERGTVVRGDDALRLIQLDPQRLALLIRSTMSGEPLEGGSPGAREVMPTYQWAMRANFEQFRVLHRQADREAAIWGATPQQRHFAFLLRHWMGSLPWPGLAARVGNPRSLAVYVYRRLEPRWSGREDLLWERLETSAGRARVGGIGARPTAPAVTEGTAEPEDGAEAAPQEDTP